jgi:hypothetical protein
VFPLTCKQPVLKPPAPPPPPPPPLEPPPPPATTKYCATRVPGCVVNGLDDVLVVTVQPPKEVLYLVR